MDRAKAQAGQITKHVGQQQSAQHVRPLHYFNLYAAPLITVVLVYAWVRLACYGVRKLFGSRHTTEDAQ